LRLYTVKRQDAVERLYQVAQRQSGFFTARQARLAGYADNTHPHHARIGNWVRVHRGIYRLARFPLAARPDLMLWQLWAHNRRGEPQGTYSHNTALSLHALSYVMPAKLDMTRVLRLHGGRLAEDDIETTDGVRVTTPLRTLVDVVVVDRLAAELQVQAFQEALQRGLVTVRQLAQVKTSRRARQRLDRVMKRVPA
jgi:predicted transcriptional regulator of viral defense system